MKFRQMKLIMNQVEVYGKFEEIYDGNPARWTPEYMTKIWEAVGDNYINQRFRGNCTVKMSWKTIYNNMQKAKVFETNDNRQ